MNKKSFRAVMSAGVISNKKKEFRVSTCECSHFLSTHYPSMIIDMFQGKINITKVEKS